MKNFHFIHACRHRHIEKSHHHFVVGLITPLDRAFRIGVVRIATGVVVPGDSLQVATRREQSRLCKLVAHLPVKVVVHPQQGLLGSVGMNQVVFESFPSQVHVGEKTEEQRVIGKRPWTSTL